MDIIRITFSQEVYEVQMYNLSNIHMDIPSAIHVVLVVVRIVW